MLLLPLSLRDASYRLGCLRYQGLPCHCLGWPPPCDLAGCLSCSATTWRRHSCTRTTACLQDRASVQRAVESEAPSKRDDVWVFMTSMEFHDHTFQLASSTLPPVLHSHNTPAAQLSNYAGCLVFAFCWYLMAQGIPENIPEDIPDDIPDDILEDTPEGIPEGIPLFLSTPQSQDVCAICFYPFKVGRVACWRVVAALLTPPPTVLAAALACLLTGPLTHRYSLSANAAFCPARF